MKKEIIKIANRKLKKLAQRYDGFLYVILDDWRGFRFIYDTLDVRKCRNDCQRCPLFNLFKEEKESVFSASLIPASPADKRLFGYQNYLNCKTLEQYKKCYLNFLKQKKLSKSEIKKELKLIKNMRILSARGRDPRKAEAAFKSDIFKNYKKLDKV
ncbi:MAG: hypothetical protein WCV50_01995 [Patescibacteria group bacterium]|jgi:hypothetical protein